MLTFIAVIIVPLAASNNELPPVTVDRDDVVIDQSCRVTIPHDAVLADRNDDGVIHVAASDITIEFAPGAVLRGAKPGTRPDQYAGCAIRIAGRRNVTLRGARITGYRCGLHASRADGLTLDAIDATDLRRDCLRSTPQAEDAGDWLYPHHNDRNEWLTQHGAAIYIEDSSRVTVKRCKLRHGQNGLCLDRVRDSRVYDNDFSFNSGWGIALWRSSKNVISRNAADFCIRGYSHKIYNRGQDSAGILLFEQCGENVIAENSATHGGDGFFGYAGHEALGETPAPPGFDHKRRGSNDNLLIRNDFSYAAAHGIEMTFSFGNRMIANRLVGNAICGVWGGFSQDTRIQKNEIAENGEMGRGMERGGIAIEHGRGNLITHNAFRGNASGVNFWGGESGLATRPWCSANGIESTGNRVARNTFDGDAVGVCVRGPGHVQLSQNVFRGKSTHVDGDAQHGVVEAIIKLPEDIRLPEYPAFGDTRPVDARKHLRGRENIVMTEWGPWDHAAPLVRKIETRGDAQVFDLHALPAEPVMTLRGAGRAATELTGKRTKPLRAGEPYHYEIAARDMGVYPYEWIVTAGDFRATTAGTVVFARWTATFFEWNEKTDPRTDLPAWRKLAAGSAAVTVETSSLKFAFGHGGPSELKIAKSLSDAPMSRERFGLIARTRLPIPKGRWRFNTTSDDGVRVLVNGKPVIENWTWHVPTRDEGIFESTTPEPVEIVVEYFELTGFATLDFNLAPE